MNLNAKSSARHSLHRDFATGGHIGWSCNPVAGERHTTRRQPAPGDCTALQRDRADVGVRSAADVLDESGLGFGCVGLGNDRALGCYRRLETLAVSLFNDVLKDLDARQSKRPRTLAVDGQSYARALVKQKEGEAESAVKTLRNAIEVHPESPNARLAVAKVLVERKQATAAVLRDDGLMLAPLWIQTDQHRWDDAATQYQVTLRNEPDKSEWLQGLGLALSSADKPRQTVDSLRRTNETGARSEKNKSMVDQVIFKLQPQEK